MNMELFKIINNLAGKNHILDMIMIFLSKDVPYIYMGILVLIFIIGVRKKNSHYRRICVYTFTFTVINMFLSFVIGKVYYVDRPFVNHKVNLLLAHKANASFPSDHAAGTLSIALGLSKYNKLLSIMLTILSVAVGFSRVYVGNHYPLDVIGAYIMVLITNYIFNIKYKHKIKKFIYGSIKKHNERLSA